jgi:hypothetical protein
MQQDVPCDSAKAEVAKILTDVEIGKDSSEVTEKDMSIEKLKEELSAARLKLKQAEVQEQIGL